MNEQPAIISTSHWRATETASSPIAGAQGGNLTTQSGQNLEQLSDEEFWDYARKLAQQLPAAQPEEWVMCRLSRGECLIPLTALYEVVRPPHRLALLPAIPEWMPGVVAWRGETIAVIDLDAYLSGYPPDLVDEGTMLVAKYAGLPIGLLVPAIGQTTLLQSEEEILKSTHNSQPATANEEKKNFRGAPPSPRQGTPSPAPLPVLDLQLLLADVVQQIETAASNG